MHSITTPPTRPTGSQDQRQRMTPAVLRRWRSDL
jgi:hypothetical protein